MMYVLLVSGYPRKVYGGNMKSSIVGVEFSVRICVFFCKTTAYELCNDY